MWTAFYTFSDSSVYIKHLSTVLFEILTTNVFVDILTEAIIDNCLFLRPLDKTCDDKVYDINVLCDKVKRKRFF